MPNLNTVHTHFSKRFEDIAPVVIAGGAVRDHIMGKKPKDYDLFLLKTNFSKENIAKIAEIVRDLPIIEGIIPEHQSEPFLIKTVLWKGATIQIMCTPFENITDLLESFDWNVCLFAYDGQEWIRTEVRHITAGESLKLQKITYPLATLRRGFRFSERFGMKLEYNDIIKLCTAIMESHKQQEIKKELEEINEMLLTIANA